MNRLKAQGAMRSLVLERRQINGKIRGRWKNYLLQCGLSALVPLLILLFVDVTFRTAISVAIASSAFIVFVMPHNGASSPRRVIGGHVMAAIVGTAISTVYLVPVFGELTLESHLAEDITAVSSVGFRILLMLLTSTEHQQATGAAIGLVVGGWDPPAILFALVGATVLSLAHTLLKSRMVNLL